ncbi:unnamed protein product [Polarella glacialis]|uniref:Uncharacterized protein n=1 Tax=Polarella glacialis TaxID=89957 RepID=A0A813LVQ0_POLGL|nr:unnamed protein product [Polarella glacialis]
MAAKGEEKTEEIPEVDLLASFPNLLGLIQGEASPAASAQLPLLPPGTSTGVLKNGLTYYVLENKEPKKRAELFLIVGFGSLVEEEEERGIAHIIEHLGFSATKAYENHAIVKFLESIGAPFGACQNAYTTFDRTVYTLHVPTDKEGLVDESLRVLREFAYYTRISEEDLDKERKVVLEEWRESRSAQGRLSERYIQALCGSGCRWCERLPIGKEEVIRGVSSETLRAFYRKFYHPARMAVVAVGDFEGGQVVKSIQDLFDLDPQSIDPLPRCPSSEAPERPRYAVPDSEGVRVASSTDPELSFATSMLDCKRPRLSARTVADFRRRVKEDLFHRALSSRLLRLTVQGPLGGGPRDFFSAGTETGEPLPALSPLSASLAPLPGRVRPAIKGLLTELERVRRFGFHPAEVQRAKRSCLAEFEQDYIERPQCPSDSFAEQFVGLFLDEDHAVGVIDRAKLAAQVLPTIPCEEVSSVASLYDFQRNVVVKIATPLMSIRNPAYTLWSMFQACRQMTLPRPKLDLPDEAEVAQILSAVASAPLEAWPQDEDDVDMRLRNMFDSCAQDRLSAVHSTASREVQAPGVPKPSRHAAGVQEGPLGEEFILQNGLRIFLKDTDLFDDEILVKARRWGGLSEHQEPLFLRSGQKGAVSCEAQVCSMVATMLGICGLSVESLQECLEGKRIDPAPPSLEAYSTSLDSSSSPPDLESLLMLLSLMFLKNVEAGGVSASGRLSLVKLGLLAWRLGEDRDPQSQFGRRVKKATTGDHPYTWLPSLWRILRLNFSKSCQVFNERTSMPREWTFVMVGRLPPREILLPLLERYLGCIPNRTSSGEVLSNQRPDELAMRQAVTPMDIRFPDHAVRDEVHLQMVEPKGSTVLCFPVCLRVAATLGVPGSSEDELRELLRLRLLVRLLETRLVEVLRFQRGQVYSVHVGDDLGMSAPQLGVPRKGTLSVGFECDPAESDELVQATQAELQRLRDGSAAFTAENVIAALEQERREFEELVNTNSYWAHTILDLYFSRCFAVTGEIGGTMSLWWRLREEVNTTFDESCASKVLQAILPAGAPSVVVAMRPKGNVVASAGEQGGRDSAEQET